MSEKSKITCDGCGSNLTTTGNSIDYRLVLANESIPLRGNFATDMMIYPPVDGTKHFCRLDCLRRWVDATPR